MAWRLAKSLVQLREQINALSPNRSKVSDGTIGDTAHSARASDHNPDGSGVVRAMDITHDPGHGVGGRGIAEAIRAARDSRVKYIISDGEIMSGAAGPKPWQWRRYTGKNPHRHHVHLSVVAGKAGDDARPWVLNLAVAPSKVVKPPKDLVVVLAKGAKGIAVEKLQRALNAAGAKPAVVVDGDFGDRTDKAVRAFQRAKKLVVDGKVGPATWEALGA